MRQGYPAKRGIKVHVFASEEAFHTRARLSVSPKKAGHVHAGGAPADALAVLENISVVGSTTCKS